MHILWDHGHLSLEPEGPTAYYYGGPYPPTMRPPLEALRHPLQVGERGDSTLEINRAFVKAVAQRDPTHIRSPFRDAMRSLASVLGANQSATRSGALVSVGELMGTLE